MTMTQAEVDAAREAGAKKTRACRINRHVWGTCFWPQCACEVEAALPPETEPETEDHDNDHGMIERKLTDRERTLIIALLVNAVPEDAPDPNVMSALRKLSGVDVEVITRRPRP